METNNPRITMKYLCPFTIIFKASKKLFGNINCIIAFDDKIGANNKPPFGFIQWNPKEKVFEIAISAHLPVIHAAEIISHEISHAVVGLKNGHNKKWQHAFATLQKECNKMALKYNK